MSLFFVLSGFSIHWSTLHARRPGRPAGFLRRRLARIYPAYLAALVAFAAWEGVAPWFAQFGSHLLLVHNWSAVTFDGINGSFWPLAVEAQLYLLYLMLLPVARLGGCGLLLLPLAGLTAACQAACVLGGYGAPVAGSPLATAFDWWLGAWVAERAAGGRPALTRGLAWPLVALGLAGVTALFPVTNYWRFGPWSVAWALFLDRLVRRPAGGAGWKMWGAVGTVSYSLYLWHQPLLVGLAGRVRLPPGGKAFALLGTFPAFVLLAWGMYRLTERPFLRVKGVGRPGASPTA